MSNTEQQVPFEVPPSLSAVLAKGPEFPLPPILTFEVRDSEESRAMILGLISEDKDQRAATEQAIMDVLQENFLPYARAQAVKIKQGKL